jgi:hypothetical protein
LVICCLAYNAYTNESNEGANKELRKRDYDEYYEKINKQNEEEMEKYLEEAKQNYIEAYSAYSDKKDEKTGSTSSKRRGDGKQQDEEAYKAYSDKNDNSGQVSSGRFESKLNMFLLSKYRESCKKNRVKSYERKKFPLEKKQNKKTLFFPANFFVERKNRVFSTHSFFAGFVVLWLLFKFESIQKI